MAGGEGSLGRAKEAPEGQTTHYKYICNSRHRCENIINCKPAEFKWTLGFQLGEGVLIDLHFVVEVFLMRWES